MKDFRLLLKHLKLGLVHYLIDYSKSVQIRIEQDIILWVALPGGAKLFIAVNVIYETW